MILTTSNNYFITLFKITEIKAYFSQQILPSNFFVTKNVLQTTETKNQINLILTLTDFHNNFSFVS